MSEIKLTLNPTPAAPKAEAAAAAETAVQPAAPEAVQEPVFTPEEQAQFSAYLARAYRNLREEGNGYA